MVKGERAEVTAPAATYGFGPDENARRGLGGADVMLHVVAEVHDVLKDGKESWDMSFDEKLAAGQQYKEQGNVFFKAQQVGRASRLYKEAIEFFRYDTSFSDDEKKRANELKLPCHLNFAACALKQKDYRVARDNCDKALAIDANNVKALFRRAQAFSGTFDHELAQRDLMTAAKLEPANKDVRALMTTIQADLKKQAQREKQVCACGWVGCCGVPNGGSARPR